MTVPSIVSVEWLAKAVSKANPAENVSILDGSWRPSSGSVVAKKNYLDKHIPGATFFDIDECRDKTSSLPRMLPDEELFGDYVSKLGITNDSHVIVYDNNEDFGVFSSPRVWWMFRAFGHKSVSVLNGGFRKWLDQGLPTESGKPKPTADTPPFKATFNPSWFRDFESMAANVKSGGSQTVVDARSRDLFLGKGTEPKPGIQVGHIRFAKNVPFFKLLDDDKMSMKDPEELKEIFSRHEVDLSKSITTSCGSGVSACIVAFAAHLSGAEDVSVYDGSWSEWSKRASADLVATD